jgi:hypothetical protein
VEVTRETTEWDELESAGVTKDSEYYQSVSDKTFELLARQGWCIWECGFFNGEKISVIQDKEMFNKQLRFTDPLRIPAQYPLFTVEELHELMKASDEMIRRVYLFKKNSPAPLWVETGS